jgi:hypothetical protein
MLRPVFAMVIEGRERPMAALVALAESGRPHIFV